MNMSIASLLKYSVLVADIVPDGDYTSNFSYCFKIVNSDRYPNSSIFASIGDIRTIPNPAEVKYLLVKSDRCISIESGYMIGARIAAVSKDLVKPQDLVERDGETFIQSLALKKALIQADKTVSRPRYLPGSFAGSNVEESVRIDKLDRQNFVISILERPEPGRFSPWIALPLIGAAILGWLILQNQKKKSNELK
jgi:hypothetical protein